MKNNIKARIKLLKKIAASIVDNLVPALTIIQNMADKIFSSAGIDIPHMKAIYNEQKVFVGEIDNNIFLEARTAKIFFSHEYNNPIRWFLFVKEDINGQKADKYKIEVDQNNIIPKYLELQKENINLPQEEIENKQITDLAPLNNDPNIIGSL